MLRCTQDKERQQILQLNDLNLEKFGTFSSEKPAIVIRDIIIINYLYCTFQNSHEVLYKFKEDKTH